MKKPRWVRRIVGRRAAKVLFDDKWHPSPDFIVLSDQLYSHVIRMDQSPRRGTAWIDARKYINWWKLRTSGRTLEFSALPVLMTPEEEEEALQSLFDLVDIEYDIVNHQNASIAVLDRLGFRSLLVWNCRVDPYEALKCINETTQTSDFREHQDRNISFLSIPRSHLPELADQEAVELLERWRTNLVTTVRRRTLQATDNTDVVGGRNASTNTNVAGTNSSSETIVLEPSNSAVEAPTPGVAPAPWTSVAWTLGAQVLSHGIAALANEHNLSIRRRQLVAQTTAVTAENDARFWNNMFTLGVSSVQAALQYYRGTGNGRIES
ncbi:hypothetical protein BS47DRAFT_1337546 [Hydnum rufescens UP504]|uniref:DUF7514 domain-containing protein n=1 Tax=Hydnum rufescens UP504 TaxID=1448309 RepID=A0A9P6E1B7_9AGAM|nr:hypothetical protein BS47DRAFT_1337546 [Hydnum rufescens UP504]